MTEFLPPAGSQPPANEAAAQPEIKYYDGTDVPQLTMEQDGEWLRAILPEGQLVNADFMQRLNNDVNVAQGLQAARVQARAEYYASPVADTKIGAVVMGAQRRAYRAFIGGPIPIKAQTGMETAAIFGFWPSRAIALTRVLHDVVGENIDEVAVTGRHLYRMPPRALQARIELLRSHGVDPRAVLLASPNTLGKKPSQTEEDFIRLAQAAEQKYHEKLAAVERSTGAAAVSSAAVAPEQPAWREARLRKRVRELAELTGMSGDLLEAAFPHLGELAPRAFEQAAREIRDAVEGIVGRDVRLRDILGCIPAQKPKDKKDDAGA